MKWPRIRIPRQVYTIAFCYVLVIYPVVGMAILVAIFAHGIHQNRNR